MDVASIGRRFDCDETLARLAALGTLSRIAGEGGRTAAEWVGEGGFLEDPFPPSSGNLDDATPPTQVTREWPSTAHRAFT